MQATPEEWTLTERMHAAGMADNSLAFYMQHAKKQHEVYREAHPVEHEGMRVTMRARCRFDFLAKQLNSGADLKTTACATQAAFVASIEHFDYDRAAAWYMDLARLDSFMIVGIGKTKKWHNMGCMEAPAKIHPVFKVRHTARGCNLFAGPGQVHAACLSLLSLHL